MGFQKLETLPTRGKATTDYLFAGKKLSGDRKTEVHKSPSDHNMLKVNLNVEKPRKIRLELPNRKAADELTPKLLAEAQSPSHWIQLYKEASKQIPRTYTLEPRPYKNALFETLTILATESEISEEIMRYWREVISNTERLRFSERQRTAFNDLRKISKYNTYEKRDGGIYTEFLDSQGNLVDDKDAVEASVIEDLKQIQGEFQGQAPDFPKEEPSDEDLTEMEWFGTKKAMSLDLVSPMIFAKGLREKTKRFARVMHLGDLDSFPEMFLQRVIPLNKEYPKVPARGKFRPIVVSSPMIKLLEARFIAALK